MKNTGRKNLPKINKHNADNAELFAMFRDRLVSCCLDIGLHPRRSRPAEILNAAACNTFVAMNPDDAALVHYIIERMPDIIIALLQICHRNDADRMMDLNLGQLSAYISMTGFVCIVNSLNCTIAHAR